MSCDKKAISTIIATILTISLAVVGSAVYYVAVTSYMRPQAGLSPSLCSTWRTQSRLSVPPLTCQSRTSLLLQTTV